MIRFYRKFFRNEHNVVLFYLVVIGVWTRFAAKSILALLRGRKRRRRSKPYPA